MKFAPKSLSTLCIDVQGGGESLNQLNECCVSCLNKIAQEHTGNLQASFLIFFLFPKSLWVTTLHQSLKEAKQISAFYVTMRCCFVNTCSWQFSTLKHLVLR